MNINEQNKKELFTQGWTLVDMDLSKKDIEKYRYAVEDLRNKALKNNYPLCRCSYPHLTNDNLSAIESPFNKLIINEDVKEFFQKINIGESIMKLMNWDMVYLHLARLFIMRKYKYLGNWHVDFQSWDGDISKMKTIQVAIYLKDQDGFRIVKPEFDLNGKNTEAIRISPPDNPYLPLNLPSKYFSEIRGKAGTVLFFAPGLFHQGNSNSERLDFHFRFSNNKNINKITDEVKFYKSSDIFKNIEIPAFYLENFNIIDDKYSPYIEEISKINKFKNTLNYYTCLINFYKYFIKGSNQKIDKPWTVNLFSNTIFQ